MKIPKKIGSCADLLYKLREERLELSKKVDEMKKQETQLKNYIIETLPKSEASGVAGAIARVSVVTKEEPVVEDQDAFRKYLNRSKRFDLAYKLRPSAPGIKELWEEGKDIPGISKFNVVTVSLGKV